MDERNTPVTDEQADILTELPIDLRREEYVTFCTLLDRANGASRARLIAAIAMELLGLMLLVAAAVTYVRQNTLEPTLVFGSLAAIIAGGLEWCVFPLTIRARARKAYDRTVAAGHDYFGRLAIGADRIEKVQRERTVTVPFAKVTLYIEPPDMIVFGSSDAPAIVLPARCMTPAAAAAARHAADRLTGARRFFYGRLQPQGLPVAEPSPKKDETLWEQRFRYTEEEFVECCRASVTRSFTHRLPLYGVSSAVLALLFGLTDETRLWPIVGLFLLLMGLSALTGLVLPRARIARVGAENAFRDMSVRMTERGVRFVSGGREIIVPWGDIRHVYESERYVDLRFGRQSMPIPKRCIEDIDGLSAVIDRCRETSK